MEIQELLSNFVNSTTDEIHLYFIIRKKNDAILKKDKKSEKFIFQSYRVDVDIEIKKFLKDITLEECKKLQKQEKEFVDYDIVSDDIEHLFTYKFGESKTSFSDVVFNQLSIPMNLPNMESMQSFEENGELWAYCVEFSINTSRQQILTFRKIKPAKIVVDERQNPERSLHSKIIQALFNTNSQKLEIIQGDTIALDKQIDCLYCDNIFYVLQKTGFEQIVGLKEEYKQCATTFVLELKNLNFIEGIELIQNEIENNPTIHKKLVRIAKLGNYKDFTSETLKTMQEVAEKHEVSIKIKDEKLIIEEHEDIDNVLKMLADYYKRGEVTGKSYGTFSGKVLTSPSL